MKKKTEEVIKEAVIKTVDDGQHKCDTCSLVFENCGSTSAEFVSDRYPDEERKDGARVIVCGMFTQAEPETFNANFPIS